MIAAERAFQVSDYDLSETLGSGQAFRWRERGKWWEGVVGSRWVRLRLIEGKIIAQAAEAVSEWGWLEEYLQSHVRLSDVLDTFPPDASLQSAVAACRGLRLLRQDPWEALASFICSSTKQIVQIQEIISLLCQRFGEPVAVPSGHKPINAFPSCQRLAEATEAGLRECKMGFRAPYLLEAARRAAAGKVSFSELGRLPLEEARARLEELPGVGPKIADCVLLFGCGFARAFPVDVWIIRILRELYFPRRNPSLRRLRQFTQEHFGPHAGYAQQYLFHYVRTKRVVL